MARIALTPPSQAAGRVSEVFADIQRQRGPKGITNIWKAYAASPGLLWANWQRMQVLRENGSLSHGLRAAISYHVSRSNQCTR